MLHAVLLLVTACQFVLFYASLKIVSHIGSHHKTILSTAVHSLRIDVVAGLTILHKPSVCLEFLEIFHRLLIHLRVVFVGAGSKINLRADNVIERFFIVARFFTGFF